MITRFDCSKYGKSIFSVIYQSGLNVCTILYLKMNACTLFLLQMFFRGKVQDEEGYVLYVRKNALQVLIPKYGLEGTIYLTLTGDKNQTEVKFVYNEEVLDKSIIFQKKQKDN